MADHLQEGENPGYETTDAHIKPLLYIGLVVLVLMASSFLGMIPLLKVLGYYQPLLDDPVPTLVQERITNTTSPRLQIDPPRMKFDLEDKENETLGTYAWVDEDLKVVRIPIDRTIELVRSGVLALPKAGTTQ
jgi:hypothetical protein